MNRKTIITIYILPPLYGSNTYQDSDKNGGEHEENRMWCFCKTSSFKQTFSLNLGYEKETIVIAMKDEGEITQANNSIALGK